ncbi:angelicin synthase-like [Ipomoea triloba]|uniref:angelicin synthase-like n=1 Tax=Ipomoea triloba TaxID=35885 RepID=UPI00125D2D5E|nr:angelicin synthase-like [Ipomoea triloba]
METLALFTLFSVLLLSAAVWVYAKSSKKARPPLPPGPLGFPVVGYLPFLRPNLHHHFTDLARNYGPIFKLQLGSCLAVVVNSPSIAKQVVRDHDAVFANRDPPIAAIVGTYGGRDIAFAPSGTYWRDLRKVFVREMLSGANLRACYEHRREEVRKVIRGVKSRIGEPVNIGELASSTELNVVARMIWGSTLGSDEEKNEKIGAVFRELMGKYVDTFAEPNISDFFPWLARFDLQGIQAKMEGMRKDVDNILEPIIKEGVRIVSEKSRSVSESDEKKDFLQILLELKERDDIGRSLDFQAIKAILLDIVIGGTDTTATMVEWVMTTLLDNPEIMKKVQKELEEIVGLNNIVEEVHLPKLSYLDAVVKETFRLYPALPLLVPRCPTNTTQVGGYTIPKSTRVFLNMYAIHRDPQLWDNPLEFRPERFLNQTSSGLDYTGNDHRFLPFGSGRRICAGIPLAEKMLIYILSSLLHSFDWHLPEGENLDLSDKFGIVTKKCVPLIVVPAQRLSKFELYQ